MDPASDTTYGSYLRVEELLGLQGAGDAHDELLFVVIHQSHELWFKLALHEVDRCIDELLAGQIGRARSGIVRVTRIVDALVHQWQVLDTMTPQGYLEFRSDLQSGSGFQSAQFRELEGALGRDIGDHEQAPWLSPRERARLAARRDKISLAGAFSAVVAARGATVPDLLRGTDDPELSVLAEALVDLDEAFALWRNRHVLAVERQIGAKPGTGGSQGVGYLRSTTLIRFFPELWDERSLL